MSNARTISTVADLQHQTDLLLKEFDYEKEMFRTQTEQEGILRKIQQGLCWYPISTGRSYYNSLNQLVIEVERLTNKDIEHNFEYGRSVAFFSNQGNNLHYFNFQTTISYVQDDRMVVVLPSDEALVDVAGSHDLGIQISFDETSYKAMLAALKDVMQAKGNRLAELREKLIGNVPEEWLKLFPLRFPWLNASQEEAVNHVLSAKDVAIVHGPPGTGKTTTLVEAIYETLHRENQVLVCAQSNTAVDWISEKLVDRGMAVLRIGNPTRVNDKMLSFTYERRFEAHPDYPELWSIRKSIREMQGSMRKKSRDERDTVRNRISRLKLKATELEVQIDQDLFDNARVISCTLVGSSNRLMTEHHFDTLFIDEAAQALEAACWIAIAHADRVILAGDHHQLPPTIKCIEAMRGGLDRTLMEKIAERKPDTVSQLTIQYRMHEDIMRFPSHWFYHDLLKAAPEVRDRGILDLDIPIVWYDTSELDLTETTKAHSMSHINDEEAALMIEQLKMYIEKIGKERILDENIDFGVISPYRAQMQLIRNMIRHDEFFRKLRKQITVHTVDGFQGQERDVIVISLVRANDNGSIGFLKDLRRMNVAITRARMKLIIVGDSATMNREKFYREFYQYIQEKGAVYMLVKDNK